jgi:hypothetical protein
MEASEQFRPGQRVGVHSRYKNLAVAESEYDPAIGIVDPYLTGPVPEGATFWLCLFPGTITSLRHDWTHPAFQARQGHKSWLMDFADKAGMEYQELMDGAENFLNNNEMLCEGDKWDYFRHGYDPLVFWEHYSAATGQDVPLEKRDNFFTCNCV